VYYGFPDDHGLEADTSPSYSERTTGFFSFRGMTIIYICSRLLLSAQYLLLYFYARRKNYPASNQFLLQIGGLLLSACMWIGTYFLEGENVTDAMRIAKFGLWYGGIAVELISTLLIWLCCRVTGFRRTHLTERFATLTLLILGEGVIGYAIALQGSIFRPLHC
jgi:low temperature requirement protein LtrA